MGDRVVKPRFQHGEGSSVRNRTKEYRTWAHVKGRCRNPKDACYPNYGGRGISMCDAWANSYKAFLDDVGRAPTSRHSIDRIDNNKGYEPGNVRWATPAEQNRNTRRTILVDGIALKDACETKGLSYEAVQARIRRGDPIDIALSPLTGRKYRELKVGRYE